ncbi:hypothetical protein G7068_07265 [Leucobacter viscericola]|uniref:Calcineurin-like phosphoesterase domain-containing protein n=1 Tax=Leucobacter viscericola TaxID=2714935 RepID=A0A6G7XEW9_9MICO|nr:hypothetical protein [Leucobacter viscericola]QIK63016.1 hypothetical protein G7068_07265 [Leucobacter viscericola]
MINHITDTQQGAFSYFTDNWCERVAKDIVFLREFTSGHVHTGDCIEWYTEKPEDEKYQAFRQTVMTSGKPYLDLPGNHDLTTFRQHVRSANEWAASVVGREKANSEMLLGDVAVLGISPDYIRRNADNTGYLNEYLSSETISWLDEKLQKYSSKRVWIGSHYFPLPHARNPVGPTGPAVGDWNKISEVLASHGNVVGWLSGDSHRAPGDQDTVRRIQAGNRKIWSINAPSSSGLGNPTAVVHQWTRYAGSLYVTDTLDDAIEVRWRNHLSARWENPLGEYVKVYRDSTD